MSRPVCFCVIILILSPPNENIMKTSLLFTALLFSGLLYGQGSENVVLLDVWHDESIETIDLGIRYNEVWGFVQNGAEYGVIGSKIGTHFFRLTDNDQLEEVAFVPGAFQGNVIHRDFHDYEGYLYAVCDQGSSTLQIMDLSGLPDSVSVVYDSNEHVTTAHNVFIDTATAKLYLAGSSNSPLRVLSLENPTEPEYLLDFYLVNYVHDLFVRNDTAWLNCANEGLLVLNFSQGFPVALGSLSDYPDQGYNHSGWLSEDGNKYVFADETDGMRMKVCDVSDLSDIQVNGLFGSMVSDNSVAHNLQIIRDTVYVSHYNDGLQVFDVTNPNSPQRIAWYDTFTGDESYSYNGAWGVYALLPSQRILISDRTNGLHLFRLDFTSGVTEKLETANVRIYPNPSTGLVNIETSVKQPHQILLYNFAGQQVAQQPIGQWYSGEKLTFNWSDLPTGMYVIEIRGESDVVRTNWIKF